MTVDAILGATAQILRVRGLGQTTTRAIADRAGVSVGSLYQYFPSKEAVVRALALHERERVLAALHETLETTRGASLEDRTCALVETLLAIKMADPELGARLAAAMLEIDGPCYFRDDTEPFRLLVRQALAELGVAGELDLISFVIVRALEGVLTGAATGERRFDDPNLAGEITRLVLGYVATTAPSA